MRVEAIEPTPNAMARAGLALIVATVLALAFLAPGRETPTLAQPIPTETATPAPTAIPPCPGNTIDRNGNGQDNGDCVSVTSAVLDNPPVRCGLVSGSAEQYGRVICQPRWILSGVAQDMPVGPILANQGCLDVRRNPYPRLMVGLAAPSLTFNGVLPTGDASINPSNWMTGYSEGWYQTSFGPSGRAGLPIDGGFAAGNWLGQAFGGSYTGPEYPPVRLDLSAIDIYPSINNISLRLVYVHMPDDLVDVSISGSPAPFTSVDWDRSSPLRFLVNRSSNPAAAIGADDIVSSGGPARNGQSTLPAYRVQIESRWTLYAQWRFELWEIRNNVYQPAIGGGGAVLAPIIAGGRVSTWPVQTGTRAWDSQQRSSVGLVDRPNCNAIAGDGYIPVPVMEGHSVLIR